METVDVTDLFTETKKKKLPVPLRILRACGIVLLVLVLAVAGGMCFSALNRAKALSVLPPGAALYVHTDSAWGAVNPLIDLQAADVLLSEPSLVQFRSAFMRLRTADVRKSALTAWLLARRVDAALYTAVPLEAASTASPGDGAYAGAELKTGPDAGPGSAPSAETGAERGAETSSGSEAGTSGESFVAAVDFGSLSLFTRLFTLVSPFVHIPGLELVHGSPSDYFIWTSPADAAAPDAGAAPVIYIKPLKNLVVISTSPALFQKAISAGNERGYTEQNRALLTSRSVKKQPVRLFADASQLAQRTGNSRQVQSLLPLISRGTLSELSFGITDAEISASVRLPLSEHASSIPLLSTSASLPPLVSRLPDIVQYYTVLNAGTLSDLKSSLSPYIPPEKNFDALWRRADGACRALFSLSLEDVLYSWTGSEFAAFGLEGHSLPVFAVQIRDEAKRAEIFDQVLSSFLIKDDMSLIIDGVRLPRITVPSFIESLLAVCNISIPSPYYLVHDGYIFFSVAPEALSAVYTSMKTSGRLSKTAHWRAVSDSLSNDVQVSLFYNLERSIPFFLRTPGVHTKILELYTIGRADLRIKDGDAVVSLHAVARHAQDARAVPGFPVPLEGKAVPEILAEPGKNPSMLFWLEDGTKICSFDSSSMEQKSIVLPERLTLSSPNQAVNKNGVLWAVTQSGAVYLFDRNLEVISPFPVLTGERPSAGGAAYGGDALLVPLTGGSLCLVNSSGSVSLIQLPATGQLRSAPAVSGTTAAVYEKSFAGKIWLIENGALTNGDNPLSVPGIAFGSPALIRKGSLLYVAFITQAGAFYLWENGELRDGFPLQLDGVFYLNAEASGSYFYVLDSTAVLTRIGVDGSILRVAVPASTARNGFLTVAEPEKSGRASLYVCPDGNTLYGFSSSLELLSGFPVSGWGRPAFADVNGDKRADCFTLTLDNTLTAWNVR